MQKDSLTTCLAALVLGAFGFFVRWFQLDSAFEPETGLAIPGSIWHTFMVVICIVAVLFFAVQWILMRIRRYSFSREFVISAYDKNLPFQAAISVFSLMVAVAGLLILKNAGQHLYPALQRFLGLGAILTAVCTALLALSFNVNSPLNNVNLRCLTSAIPILFICLWLIIAYHENANNPTLWAYGIYILTVSGILVSFFLLAGYFFEKPRPMALLFATGLTIFLCVTSMADAHELGIRLLILGSAGILLLYTLRIIQTGSAKH